MKILIPDTISFASDGNPYVRVLRDSLIAIGHEVTCSRTLFWERPTEWDMIYFQWPECILNKEKTGPDLEQIANHIEKIKKSGVFILITVHNLYPHIANPFVSKVYDFIYSQMDAFHHMGEYSYSLFKVKYPNAFNFIAPHPIYYDVEKIGLSVSECKKKWNISKNKITIIAFGMFRNAGEKRIVLDLKKKFKNIILWAPKLYLCNNMKKRHPLVRKFINISNYIRCYLVGIKMNRKKIYDDDVMPMINAADVLLIQRNNILNSGNLPLGFSAKKIVVGPNVGNVGILLKKTGNPVFNPNDKESIYNAVEMGIKMFQNNNKQGVSNYQYAKENWTPKCVAEKIITELKKFITE